MLEADALYRFVKFPSSTLHCEANLNIGVQEAG
jgi:hypothetical protein